VNTVIDIRFPRYFLARWLTISFSKGTLIYEVIIDTELSKTLLINMVCDFLGCPLKLAIVMIIQVEHFMGNYPADESTYGNRINSDALLWTVSYF
jgi:hypothetical protein